MDPNFEKNKHLLGFLFVFFQSLGNEIVNLFFFGGKVFQKTRTFGLALCQRFEK